MRTLVIISHPALEESHSQNFLRESLPEEGVTWHHLEKLYSDGTIPVHTEQELLLNHERILFQFPFYWYSSPPLLKKWQDEVLTEGFAFGTEKRKLAGKEFGLVIHTGVQEREYQAGGKEGYTISELTRPFQAMASKCGMTWLPTLLISRFDYMNDQEQKRLLIRYRQYLTKENHSSLRAKEEWFKKELETLGKAGLSEQERQLVDVLIQQMEENREHLDDLNWTLQEMKEGV